ELERRLLRVQGGDLTEARMLLGFCTENPDEPETCLVLEALIVGLLQALDPTSLPGVPKNPDKAGALEMAGKAGHPVARATPRAGDADANEALVWRGRLHLAASEPDKAARPLREVLERDPDHFEARFALALAVAPESHREAAEHLGRLLRLDPKHRRVRYHL